MEMQLDDEARAASDGRRANHVEENSQVEIAALSE